ncbi:DNA methyltransferase [Azospirillum sp. TSH64]|uniref:DNA-methyltransferase n=1 Tax=Azospirillum sp. TSH64 TaxID=652740 RepID=UPI000D641F61|nr:DNA methyltransferase [Azospirillum sp. TSH64]
MKQNTTAATSVTIGAATLLLGDCIERMQDLPDGSVSLVLTDVPYSSGATREAGKTAYAKTMTRSTKGDPGRWFGSDSLSTRGFLHLLRSCAMEWQRVLKPGGHVLAFIDWRMGDHLADAIDGGEAALFLSGHAADAMESADLKRVGLLVWDKTYFGMGTHFRLQHELIHHFTKGKGSEPLRRNVANVLRHAPVRFGAHPTEKPVELLAELIGTVCPAGETVLDCFAGSFSTGHAALTTGRRFIGIERDRRYFETGWQRLANLTEELAA